jgi:KaiC/GvpD/RAD55 family RecA-like ATPase
MSIFIEVKSHILTKVGVSLTTQDKFNVSYLLKLNMIVPKRLSDLINEYGLSEDGLNQPMKTEHCDEIAIVMGEIWERLATAIGLEEFIASDIREVYYRKPEQQRIALLRKWKERYGKEATYAKMVHGLEEIKNRKLTELVIKLCRECTQKGSTCVDNPVKTRKGEQHNTNTGCISKLEIALALALMCLALIFGLVLDIQTDISTLLGTSHVHNDSAAMALWSPKFQEGNSNCSQEVGHDLPLLYGLFIGRENDISNVMEKAKKANILNINGAPGFGKSTLAIHVGYRLVDSCISVRYINMEELSWRTLAEFTDEAERSYETELKSDSKLQDQTTAATVTSSSSSLEHRSLSESSNTAESGYQFTNKLKKWSQNLNQTTYLIFDNTDVILEDSSILRTNIKFVDLVTILVENSKLHLHILVVSQTQLLLLEHFDRWVVKELNLQASIELLSQLAPGIDGNQLRMIAELLQGCSIALKVVGKILHVSGQGIIQELQNELEQQPLDVLDKVSDHRQRFRHIMDLIFSKLNYLKCGYVISFFPSSFSKEAGIAILASSKCLEMYERQSLLDDYFLGYQHRYKIHRLIREYLKSKVTTEENEFQSRFCNYYTQFLLQHANESRLNVIDEQVLESESKNIHLLQHILLSDPRRKYSTAELLVIPFLIRKGYITEMKSLQNMFKQYLMKMQYFFKEENIPYDAISGECIAYIVKYFYSQCKCESVEEYIEKCFVDNNSCIDIFSCEVVTELQDMYPLLNLSQQEQQLLNHIGLFECENLHWFESFSLHFVCFLLVCAFPIWFHKLISSLISYSREPIVCTYTVPSRKRAHGRCTLHWT